MKGVLSKSTLYCYPQGQRQAPTRHSQMASEGSCSCARLPCAWKRCPSTSPTVKRRVSLGFGLIVLATLPLACQGTESMDPGEWSQFRGPAGLGISPTENLPATWSEESVNVLWKTQIPGTGNSSPIVSHGRVFLTTSYLFGKRQARKSAIALDLDSGELLWETEIHSGYRGKRHHLNTFAAPTPVTDGRQVYVHFGDVLAALDREGQILWKNPIDPQYVEFAHYGAASSPVLTDRVVIVAQDREEVREKPGWLAAFDRQTGKEMWRTTWEDSCCSYTTPLVRRRGDREEVIFVMAGSVRAFDALTGEVLWRRGHLMDQPVASPVTEGDLLTVFSGAHTNKYGAMLRLSGSGKETRVELLWDTKRMIPQTASPLLLDGRLYTLTEQGVMACFNALSGKQLWKKRLPQGSYRSSLIAGDGKIYAVSGTGHTIVIAATEKFEMLSNNPLAEGGNASPAIVGDTILIRTESSLYRIASDDQRPAA